MCFAFTCFGFGFGFAFGLCCGALLSVLSREKQRRSKDQDRPRQTRSSAHTQLSPEALRPILLSANGGWARIASVPALHDYCLVPASSVEHDRRQHHRDTECRLHAPRVAAKGRLTLDGVQPHRQSLRRLVSRLACLCWFRLVECVCSGYAQV